MKKLTIEERIDKYMQKYPYPLERLYPTVIIKWSAYGKNYYYNLKTGKTNNLYPKDFSYGYKWGNLDEHGRVVDLEGQHLYIPGKRIADKILIPANTPCDLGYVHYSKIYHLIEICQIRFDTKRNYEGEIKTPFVIYRTFIAEENLHDIYDEHGYLVNRKEWYNTFKHLYTSYTCREEIRKIVGDCLYISGRLNITNYFAFISWIMYHSNYKTTKSLLKFEELSQEIEPEESLINRVKKSLSTVFLPGDCWSGLMVKIIGEQVFDNIACFRYIVSYKNHLVEIIRVFLLPNNKILTGKKWLKNKFKIGVFDVPYMRSIYKGGNFFENNITNPTILKMLAATNFDIESIAYYPKAYKSLIAEKLLNAGYLKYYQDLIREYRYGSDEDKFGKLNKGTKLYAILGCTKQQMQQDTSNHEISTLKEFLNTTDIRSYGIEPIKNLIQIHNFVNYNPFSNAKDILKIISISQKLKILKTLAQFKNSYGIVLFFDIIRCLRTVLLITEDENEVKSLKFWKFNSKKDLEDLHDKAIKMQNNAYKKQKEMKSQKLLNKYKLTKKKRDELYDFEDDEFIIKMPDTPIDIMEEGKALNHCVGGYMENHVEGKTTILFLRRKNDPETSFYTIEIKNNKVIQIHGKHNRWLGNNPEAIPFMRKWLAKTGAECTERILRLNATGYAGVGQLVDA